MVILGIESSCDETSAAIIKAEKGKPFVELLSNVSSTSLQLHAKTGGIIPEIAAREQIKYIIPVIKQALQDANIESSDIDAIAVTYGPGLIGSLLVGVETARTLAYAWNKPLVPVNHLFGHIYANWINPSNLPLSGHSVLSSWSKEEQTSPPDKSFDPELKTEGGKLKGVKFPAIALVVSGGHTDLVLMEDHRKIQWLGGTRDDAAGEAFDKIGRNLNFPYPAGPAFEKAAAQGNPKTYRFPRPIMHDGNYDFSFSGLKTAAIREIQKQTLTQQTIQNIARGVQDAIIDVLTYKTLKAVEEYTVSSILLSGGVAANGKLREIFQEKIREKQLQIKFYVPDKSLCTDNAAMIAAAAYYNYEQITWEIITANPELYFD